MHRNKRKKKKGGNNKQSQSSRKRGGGKGKPLVVQGFVEGDEGEEEEEEEHSMSFGSSNSYDQRQKYELDALQAIYTRDVFRRFRSTRPGADLPLRGFCARLKREYGENQERGGEENLEEGGGVGGEAEEEQGEEEDHDNDVDNEEEEEEEDDENCTRVVLKVTMGPEYPDTCPFVQLGESVGLSNAQREELGQRLEIRTGELIGNEMGFDLIGLVLEYLDGCDTGPTLSFYDQMMIEKRRKEAEEEEELLRKQEREEELRLAQEKESNELRKRIEEEYNKKKKQARDMEKRRKEEEMQWMGMEASPHTSSSALPGGEVKATDRQLANKVKGLEIREGKQEGEAGAGGKNAESTTGKRTGGLEVGGGAVVGKKKGTKATSELDRNNNSNNQGGEQGGIKRKEGEGKVKVAHPNGSANGGGDINSGVKQAGANSLSPATIHSGTMLLGNTEIALSSGNKGSVPLRRKISLTYEHHNPESGAVEKSLDVVDIQRGERVYPPSSVSSTSSSAFAATPGPGGATAVYIGVCIGGGPIDATASVDVGATPILREVISIREYVVECRTVNKIKYSDGVQLGMSRKLRQVNELVEQVNNLVKKVGSHPRLVTYRGAGHFTTGDTIIAEIYCAFVPGINMLQMLENCGSFQPRGMKGYIRDICEALHHLHENRVIHGNLKLENIIISNQNNAILDGYGINPQVTLIMRLNASASKSNSLAGVQNRNRYSEAKNQIRQRHEGDFYSSSGGGLNGPQQQLSGGVLGVSSIRKSPLAPEVTDGIGYSRKSDVWELGNIMLIMLLGIDSKSKRISNMADLAKELEFKNEEDRSEIVSFLKRCFEKDQNKRWSIEKLLRHPYLGVKESFSRRGSREADEDGESMMRDTQQDTELDVEDGPELPMNSLLSRYRTDFEEIEFLGRGGFGQVAKVRNKLDGRMYAIKRIKLNPSNQQTNKKIIREVTLLSRLHHEYIVRYFQSWIEKEDGSGWNPLSSSNTASFASPTGDDSAQGGTDRRGSGTTPRAGVGIDYNSDGEPLSSSGSDSDSLQGFSDESDDGIVFGVYDEGGSVSQQKDVAPFSTRSSNWLRTNSGATSSSRLQIQFQRPSEMEEDDDISFSSSSSSDEPVGGKGVKRKGKGGRVVDASKLFPHKERVDAVSKAPVAPFYLYIQMEYCAYTLQDLIYEGFKGDESVLWRLFRQIVEGLLHIHEQGMIHRDLKPGNIFLDSNDNIKIGDFGLATSDFNPVVAGKVSPYDDSSARYGNISLQTDDRSVQDASSTFQYEEELTGGVGTALYTSPEICGAVGVSGKRGMKYSQKVDIYSLGVIFFEMWYKFSTKMERVMVLKELRKKERIFPDDFDVTSPAGQIIYNLLDHNPKNRPSAAELLHNEHLPPHQEDEFMVEVMRSLSNPQTCHYNRLMNALFTQRIDKHRDFTYEFDVASGNSFMPLNHISRCKVEDKFKDIFHKHGAIEISTPLLMPHNKFHDRLNSVPVMDRSGGLVTLPFDLTVPFARFVARQNIQLVKRYCVSRVYREATIGGQPTEIYECDFDIVSPHSAPLPHHGTQGTDSGLATTMGSSSNYSFSRGGVFSGTMNSMSGEGVGGSGGDLGGSSSSGVGSSHQYSGGGTAKRGGAGNGSGHGGHASKGVRHDYSHLVNEAELFRVAAEIISEFSCILKGKYYFRVSHTNLVNAMMSESGVEEKQRRSLCGLLQLALRKHEWPQVKKRCINQLKISTAVMDHLGKYINCKGTLQEVIDMIGSLIVDGKCRSLANFELFESGLNELVALQRYVEIFGVTEKIVVDLSLVNNHMYYDGLFFQVVSDQPIKKKKGKSTTFDILAVGGRYDKLIRYFKLPSGVQRLHNDEFEGPFGGAGTTSSVGGRVGGVGMSVAIEKIVTGVVNTLRRSAMFSGGSGDSNVDMASTTHALRSHASSSAAAQLLAGMDVRPAIADVMVCALGGKNLLESRMSIARDLWNVNIRAQVMYEPDVDYSRSEARSVGGGKELGGRAVRRGGEEKHKSRSHYVKRSYEEVQANCRMVGINWLVVVKDNSHKTGSVKVKTLDKKTEDEVQLHDLCDYLLQSINARRKTAVVSSLVKNSDEYGHDISGSSGTLMPSTSTSLKDRSNQIVGSTGSLSAAVSSVNVVMLPQDHNTKIPTHKKKRYINTVTQRMGTMLGHVNSKQRIEVIGVELPVAVLKQLCMTYKDGSAKECAELCDTYPRYRKYLKEIWSIVGETMKKHKLPFIALYEYSNDQLELITTF
eukprot:Nk52_evm1s396 gene=Nk52_evmTU1s396